ncbi:MAG: hypothetical protein M3Q15_00225 [Pseudomonadota bacterium]|nr:hypothetical protein [Pseudomonadota bacterium]
MSKFDGEIRAAGEGSVELQELLAALGRPPQIAADRQDALAHYLSGEAGWSDARKALAGTFAKPSRRGTGLTSEQEK